MGANGHLWPFRFVRTREAKWFEHQDGDREIVQEATSMPAAFQRLVVRHQGDVVETENLDYLAGLLVGLAEERS